MNRESEFIAKHKEALRIGFECCEALKMNAVEPAPRGALYAKLAQANRELEGTSRQMFHWRGDDATWVRLGAVYSSAAKLAQRLYITQNWMRFAELGQLYALGLRRVDDLATRPTGRGVEKLILPGDISPWFEPPKARLLH